MCSISDDARVMCGVLVCSSVVSSPSSPLASSSSLDSSGDKEEEMREQVGGRLNEEKFVFVVSKIPDSWR